MPRITIVTPSFNQAKYLPETIESILNQGYPNLEYIIIDGGSTDGSVDIIKKYESHLAYWISEKDSGQSEAINKGFKKATGELFAWVNSDDVLFPGCLRRIAECYQENGRPDIIYANVAYIDSLGSIIRFVRVPHQSRFLFFQGVWHVPAPTTFFRASLFRNIGELNRNYHISMDLDMWMRMMKAGARVVQISEYLGAYRCHGETKTAQQVRKDGRGLGKEAKQIYKAYIPKLTWRKARFWRIVYKAYQVLNLNYLLAHKDYRNLKKSRRWQDVFKASS